MSYYRSFLGALGLATAIGLSLTSTTVLAQSANSDKVFEIITYNANGQPILSKLRGMTYDQIVDLLGKYKNTVPADLVGFNGQPETFYFDLPQAPTPPPSSSVKSDDQQTGVKGFLHKVKKELTQPAQQTTDQFWGWLCYVHFGSKSNVVDFGNCTLPHRQPAPVFR